MSKSKVDHHCPSTSLNNGLECWNLLRITMENKTVRPWLNRPFPSSKNSHIQNEAKCKTFQVKMSFICMRIKIIFISMALTSLGNTRLKATRKWPNGKHSYGRKFYFYIKAKAFSLSGHTWASYRREPYVTQLHDLQRFPSIDFLF